MKTGTPIGQLKSRVTVYCSICGNKLRRSLKSYVYENTPEKIEEAKAEMRARAEKKYTCRFCKY